jgi:hypothetical protein
VTKEDMAAWEQTSAESYFKFLAENPSLVFNGF